MRLALSLGPAITHSQMNRIEMIEEAMHRYWHHHFDYPEWRTAKTLSHLLRRLERLLKRLANRGVRVIITGEPDYPTQLQQLPNAPAALYVWGEIPEKDFIAIVGSRRVLIEKVKVAFQLSRELAEAGYAIISGGAIGIDTAAHQGALAVVSGQTMAILGSGLNHLYPQRNKELFAQMALHGSVVSPYPIDTPPRSWHFPQRNSLIACWAKAIIVVVAHQKSGALYTAKIAHQYQIPVLAMDGSPGTHALLRRGASYITSAKDVINVLQQRSPKLCRLFLEDMDQQKAFEILQQHADWSIDQIARKVNWKVARTAAALLRLELDGYIESVPGGRFKIL